MPQETERMNNPSQNMLNDEPVWLFTSKIGI